MEAIFENARIKCQPGAPRWASLVNKLGEEELLILCPFYISTYTVLYFHFTIPTFSCFPPFSFSVMYLYFFLLYYILPPVILFISSFSSHFLSSLSIFHFCYYNVFYLIFFSMKSFCFPLSKFFFCS